MPQSVSQSHSDCIKSSRGDLRGHKFRQIYRSEPSLERLKKLITYSEFALRLIMRPFSTKKLLDHLAICFFYFWFIYYQPENSCCGILCRAYNDFRSSDPLSDNSLTVWHSITVLTWNKKVQRSIIEIITYQKITSNGIF